MILRLLIRARYAPSTAKVAQPFAQNGKKHCFTHAYTDHAAYIGLHRALSAFRANQAHRACRTEPVTVGH